MNFNLFTWIREGVKQSILLGVSDAIETVGMPENSEDISPKFLEFMRRDGVEGSSGSSGGRSRRKRLGRTLKDMDSATSKS